MDDTKQNNPAVQPPPAVGSLHNKEQGLVAVADRPTEILGPSEVQPVISEEVSKAGIEAVPPDRPVLTDEHRKIGIEPAGESITPPTLFASQLPKTEEQAELELKKINPSDSQWGLLKLVIKHFKRIHKALMG